MSFTSTTSQHVEVALLVSCRRCRAPQFHPCLRTDLHSRNRPARTGPWAHAERHADSNRVCIEHGRVVDHVASRAGRSTEDATARDLLGEPQR